MKIKFLILFIFISIPFYIFSQVGGRHTYEFINLPSSSRVAAMGGKVISLNENELSLTYYNPALLNDEMKNQLTLNYVDYFIDINYGYVAYAPKKTRLGNFASGIHYVNYGSFIKADYTGKIDGTFKASEYAINLTWSKNIDSSFTFGVNVKPIISSLESYISFGLATDLGITYSNASRQYTTALVIRNLGTQFKPYTSKNYEPLPFEIQIAITKKLLHAPFRLSFLAHHLETFDLTYELPEEETNVFLINQEEELKTYEVLGDKILRHLNVSVEFVPSTNFYACVGYNFQRAKELSIDTRTSATGISWGFGLKIKKFQVGFGRAKYHLAGSTNNFSITTNLSEFYKRK